MKEISLTATRLINPVLFPHTYDDGRPAETLP